MLSQFVDVRSMNFRIGIKGGDVSTVCSLSQPIPSLNDIGYVCAFGSYWGSAEEIVISLFIYLMY